VKSFGRFGFISGSALMNIASMAGIVAMFLVAITPAPAADNLGIERLATCQDSWLDWKSSNPVQLQKFIEDFRSAFLRKKDTDAFFVPKSSQTIVGLPLAEVFPESVGMAVGFSVTVNASFEKAKAALEKKIGRPFKKCEPPSDNMRTCELEIGEKKTIVLMVEDNPRSTTALFGCYYFYEK
jgi:hypothetical protein